MKDINSIQNYVDEELDLLRDRFQQVMTELETIRRAHEELGGYCNDLQLKISESATEIEQIREENESLKNEKEELKCRFEGTSSQLSEISDQLMVREERLRYIYSSNLWKVMRRIAELKERIVSYSSSAGFTIRESNPAIKIELAAGNAAEILFCCDQPQFHGPQIPRLSGVAEISGWAVAAEGLKSISIYCDNRFQGEAIINLNRPDVGQIFPAIDKSTNSGFLFLIETRQLTAGAHTLRLEFESVDGKIATQEGIIQVTNPTDSYDMWREQNKVTAAQIELMKRMLPNLRYLPTFSLLIALSDKNDLSLLKPTFRSIRDQAYPHWELCIACPKNVTEAISTLYSEINEGKGKLTINTCDFRTKEEAWNLLLAQSSSDFVGLVDPGDILEPHALFEAASKLNQNTSIDLIYSDSDQISAGGRRINPFFKPDWTPDLMLSMNYIGRFWLAPRKSLAEIGGFRKQYSPSGEYDALLRLTEKASNISHIQTILYARRPKSSAKAASCDRADFDILKDTLVRRKIDGEVLKADIPGAWRVKRTLMSNPLVSIIITTQTQSSRLRKCIDSIVNKTSYRNFEIVIVDHGRGTGTETHKHQGRKGESPRKVAKWTRPFNAPAMSNYGVTQARGEYLLFLSDNAEVAGSEWIENMLEHAQRPEVGLVGARLLYPNDHVQHAGIFLGNSDSCVRYAFRLADSKSPGYHGLSNVQRNCIAVSGACLLIRRTLFEELGKFDEDPTLIFHDCDLALRAFDRGYLTVWTPYSTLYHYDIMGKHVKEHPDTTVFRQKWNHYLTKGDPYYNPNLTLQQDDFSVNEEPLLVTPAPWPLINVDRIKRILVVKLDHLGDFILSIPSIRRIKQHFPQAEITALVGSWAEPLARMEPSISNIIAYNFFEAESIKPHRQLDQSEKQRLAQLLSAYDFDLAIDLRRHPETRELLSLSGAIYTAGFANNDDFPWLTIAVPFDPTARMLRRRRHISQEIFNLVEAVRAAGFSDLYQQTAALEEETSQVEKILQSVLPTDNELIIGIHPGAGTPIKRWPPEYFAYLSDVLTQRLNACVLLFAPPDEAYLTDTILKLVKNREKVISLAGKLSLKQFLAAMTRCDLVVCNDSGPGHMAAALGVPVLGVCSGIVHAREWAPVGPFAISIHIGKSCSPCYLTDKNACPYNVACLNDLYPEKVYEAAARLITLTRRHNRI